MKIALLTEKYTPDIGGLAISSERLAKLLSSVGYEVRVFSPTFGLPPSEEHTLISSGVNITRFGAHKRTDDTLVDWFELIVEEHKRKPFDVLHAYFLTQAGFVAAYAGKYLNIPSVVSIRGNDIERAAFDPSKFSHVMYALQNANKVTTNASELVKKAKAFVNRDIFLIPNGIDIEHFKPMERNEALADALGLKRKPKGEREPVLGFVGELREKKGLKPLLLAYAQISKKRAVTLLIVGEIRQGEDQKVFDGFKQANPDLNIVVTGYIPRGDLPAYYSLIDVFVHPSLRDGMPNAVLEAMACEKVVIATAVGGIKDIVQDGKNGFLVNVNNVDMLAGKVLYILDESAKYTIAGKHARTLIQEQYTPQKELQANLDLYRSLEIGKT